MDFGNKVFEARKKQNMTQEQLADLLEVTRQTISRWESNIVYPDLEKIVKLSKILDVSCDYLLKDEKSEKQTAVTRLLLNLVGKYVTLEFYEDMQDYDCLDPKTKIKIIEFDNEWVKISIEPKKKEKVEKLINLKSISSLSWRDE